MICAYYSKGCDSLEMISGLKIARAKGFREKLNRYHVIQIDMNSEYQNAEIKKDTVKKFMMDVVDQRKKDIEAVGWCVFLVIFLTGTDIGLILLKGITPAVVASMVITAIFALIAALVAYDYYVRYINRVRSGELVTPRPLEAREKEIYGRRSEKNMYGVCSSYRRKYRSGFLVILIFAFVLVFSCVFIRSEEYGQIIPLWVVFVACGAIVFLTFTIGRKAFQSDFYFSTSDDLREFINKNGFDEMRVNTDFMMGSYHKLFRGLLTIGLDYFVIFDQNMCYVGRNSKVKKVTGYSETKEYHVQGKMKITRNYVEIIEDKTRFKLLCADGIAVDYILLEFQKLGIEIGEDKEDT